MGTFHVVQPATSSRPGKTFCLTPDREEAVREARRLHRVTGIHTHVWETVPRVGRFTIFRTEDLKGGA